MNYCCGHKQYPRLPAILAFDTFTEEHLFCVKLLMIYHSQKYTFRGKYCKFVTNRSWMMDIGNCGYLSFCMANILKMASGKPYIHKLSLLIYLLVRKTYILIKTVCFYKLNADLRIAYHLMMNYALFLVEIGGYLVFWALFEWLNFFMDLKWALKWIQHNRKPYFWHQDYKNQLRSYWVMAVSILVVHVAAILEIC